jgi:uroporphyrinogen decarboxylase
MNSKERVLKTINFEHPDRYPIMHSVLPGAWLEHGEGLYSILKKYPDYLSAELNNEEIKKWSTISIAYSLDESIKGSFTVVDDFMFATVRTFQYGGACQKGYQSDEWGCVWQKEDPGIMGIVVGHPLSEFVEKDDLKKGLESYGFPDPNALWRYDTPFLKEQSAFVRRIGKYFLVYIGNLFELLQWLIGYENFMVNMKDNPRIIQNLMDRIVNYNIETMKTMSKYDIDGVLMMDDWGTQQALMINPGMWREYFKPAYKRIIDYAKKLNLNFFFHTDGNTIEIIEDLIEIGMDVINPQFSSIDMEKLSSICKGRVCILTDIDRQYILNRAPVEEVREYVKRIIKLLGTDNGGLILRGEIGADTKLENVKAMYECFEEFGLL